jgi:hypothetical protein
MDPGPLSPITVGSRSKSAVCVLPGAFREAPEGGIYVAVTQLLGRLGPDIGYRAHQFNGQTALNRQWGISSAHRALSALSVRRPPGIGQRPA